MRTGRLTALLCVLALTGCVTTPSQPETPGEIEVERVTPWLRIESEKKVGRATKIDVAERVRRAFEFALTLQDWKSPEAICEEPLVVRLQRAKSEEGTAITQGPGLFVVRVGSELAALDGSLAEELTQVQDLRVLGPGKESAIPRFIQEGKANAVALRYRLKLGDKDSDAQRSKVIAQLKSDEVRALFDENRDRKARPHFVATSTFFIEFLGARSGDAIGAARMAKVFERVAAEGNYEAAFTAVFGLTPAAAERAFLEHLDATAGKPAARVKGTAYESLLGS